MARSAPKQKPGRSEQVVRTPDEFIAAVERRFGLIELDLAANKDNSVAPRWLGPGGEADNSLSPEVDWTPYSDGLMWLNPPFANISPWAKKCSAAGSRGSTVLLLVPASVGSEWWAAHVHNRAYVFAVRPRLRFAGHESGYPKDLALCAWNPPHMSRILPPYNLWHWKLDVVE